jgi:hypothetical protein
MRCGHVGTSSEFAGDRCPKCGSYVSTGALLGSSAGGSSGEPWPPALKWTLITVGIVSVILCVLELSVGFGRMLGGNTYTSPQWPCPGDSVTVRLDTKVVGRDFRDGAVEAAPLQKPGPTTGWWATSVVTHRGSDPRPDSGYACASYPSVSFHLASARAFHDRGHPRATSRVAFLVEQSERQGRGTRLVHLESFSVYEGSTETPGLNSNTTPFAPHWGNDVTVPLGRWVFGAEEFSVEPLDFAGDELTRDTPTIETGSVSDESGTPRTTYPAVARFRLTRDEKLLFDHNPTGTLWLLVWQPKVEGDTLQSAARAGRRDAPFLTRTSIRVFPRFAPRTVLCAALVWLSRLPLLIVCLALVAFLFTLR